MDKHLELGRRGEQIAKQFLEDNGYTIIDYNWKAGKTEIDIISWKDNILNFVEVKTRMTNNFANPEDAVCRYKENAYYHTASAFLDLLNHESEIRFDIIAITMAPEFEIIHFQDAFFPSW
ncbi:MAG: YraN family protein [Bacteroidota bacterium]